MKKTQAPNAEILGSNPQGGGGGKVGSAFHQNQGLSSALYLPSEMGLVYDQ